MSLVGKPCLECNAPLEEVHYQNVGTMYRCPNCKMDFTVPTYKMILSHLNEIYRTLMGADFIPLEITQDIDKKKEDETSADMIHLGKDEAPENVPEELKRLLIESDEMQRAQDEVVAMFEKPIEEV